MGIAPLLQNSFEFIASFSSNRNATWWSSRNDRALFHFLMFHKFTFSSAVKQKSQW